MRPVGATPTPTLKLKEGEKACRTKSSDTHEHQWETVGNSPVAAEDGTKRNQP